MSNEPYVRGPATRKQRHWNDRPMGHAPRPRRPPAPAPPQRSWWVDVPREQFAEARQRRDKS